MFLAVLGHDLRSPLSGISMAADLLSQGKLAEAARLQVGVRIRRARNVISYLTSDLLEYTRSRLGGGIPVRRVHCDLRELCEDAVDAVQGSYPDRQIELRTSGDLASHCDSHRIAQVLWNLLDNAVHHADPRRPVTLDVIGLPDSVQLRVTSFGQTIAPELLPRIFEPMTRALPINQAARPGSGLGLGLYIVREIVHAHGGTVSVTSTRDEGTVFTVELPKLLLVVCPAGRSPEGA